MGLSNGLNADASRDLNNFKDNVLPIIVSAGHDREDPEMELDQEQENIPNETDYESDQEYENALDATRNMQKSLVLRLDKIVAQNEIIMQQNKEIIKLVRSSQLSFERFKFLAEDSSSP